MAEGTIPKQAPGGWVKIWFANLWKRKVPTKSHAGSAQKTCEILSCSFLMGYELGGAGAGLSVSPQIS